MSFDSQPATAKVTGDRFNTSGRITGEVEILFSTSTTASTYVWLVDAKSKRAIANIAVPTTEFAEAMRSFLAAGGSDGL